MKTPFTVHFDKPVLADYTIADLRYWSRLPMSFANERKKYEVKGSEFLIQRAMVRPFYIDLIEICCDTDFIIPFEIEKKQLFLYFMLEGEILCTTKNNNPISCTKSNYFLISCYDKGQYLAKAPPGKHTALVVTIQPEWLEKLSSTYPHLNHILYEFHNGSGTRSMPQARMDKPIRRWIYEVYKGSSKNRSILKSILRLYISYILEHYDQVLGEQPPDPIYNVLHYLNNNYTGFISNYILASKFHITERTLLNRFREEFNTTPHQYCILLRMQLADFLLETSGKSIEEIYMEVGYSNVNAFRIAYNKYKK